MTDEAPLPISVNATSDQGQLAVAIRQLILALSAGATTLGATHLASYLGVAATTVGPLVFLITVIVGQIHERTSHSNQVAMANALRDSVAFVKGSAGAPAAQIIAPDAYALGQPGTATAGGFGDTITITTSGKAS